MSHSTAQIPRSRYAAVIRAPFHTIYDSGSLHQFGRNGDIDTTTVPEDIWDIGGAYPFPTAAAVTTVASSSAEDGVGGTGILTADVIGLVENTRGDWIYTEEEVTLNGVTPVTLTGNWIRVFRIRGHTSGSTGTSVGNIDVLHGATVLARMLAGNGSSRQAIFTVPSGYQGEVLAWRFFVAGAGAARVEAELQVRHNHEGVPNTAWYAVDRSEIGVNVDGGHAFEIPPKLEGKADLRVRITSCTVNNTIVSADTTVLVYSPI